MLKIAENPFLHTIKNLLNDLRAIEWKFPFILQSLHLMISAVLFVVLIVLYATLGFISQISNTFWDHFTSIGYKMNYSNPIQTLFYALSATVYFIIFLPFFVFQMPFWFGGWLTSKIGFKAFLILLISIISTIAVYFLNPNFVRSSIGEITTIHESLKNKYFGTDSLSRPSDETLNITYDN